MGLERFIKTVWISNIMRSLKKVHVFASLANSDYQGELHNLGDQVQIMMIGDIESKSYTKNTDIASPDDIMDAATRLIADQAYYFNFKANDVEAVQQKPALLAEATDNAAYAFRDDVDTYFASLHQQPSIQLYATGTTPFDVNSLNVEDVLAIAGETMGANNVPREGRFLTIPEWFHTKILHAGLSTKTANDALFANGFIDRVLGWDLFLSNNISQTNPVTGDHAKIMGGIKNRSYSFAGVISTIEAYRPEKRFEDAVKGLYIFGGKVIRPDTAITIHADKTAEV